jgi:hypothetical protein
MRQYRFAGELMELLRMPQPHAASDTTGGDYNSQLHRFLPHAAQQLAASMTAGGF